MQNVKNEVTFTEIYTYIYMVVVMSFYSNFIRFTASKNSSNSNNENLVVFSTQAVVSGANAQDVQSMLVG